jgi:lipoprotein NlpD
MCGLRTALHLGLAAGLASALLLGACASQTPAPVHSREARQPPGAYQVKKGDTLYGIAWRYGLDYREVGVWNGIASPYRIYTGQVLRLQAPGAPVAKPKAARTAPLTGTPAATAQAAGKPPQTVAQAPVVRRQAASGETPPGSALRWRWPLQGQVVQTFRARDRTRQGIRIKGQPGQRVEASEAGKVVYSGSGLIGYGNLIIVKHNKDYLSAYGFNRKLLVKEGALVAKGEPVAEVGQAAGGTYQLHFEIRRNGTAVDPLRLLPRR